MADVKISALPASTTPLAGTEVLPIVQSGVTKKVSVADLTAGRSVSVADLTASIGNVIIGTSGKGIDFSATPQPAGMTSELLADYEEGTWTPTLSFGTPGDLSVAYTTQIGTYTKVGNIVTVSFNVVTSTFTWTTSAAFLKMNGLPYAAGANDQGVGIGTYGGITRANYTQVGTRVVAGQTFLIFNHAGSGQTPANVVAGISVFSGTNVILLGQITYTV